jgi:predicted enzyme related to lactoylglutathione lyase
MRPVWLEIPTTDVEISKRFYARVLGWEFEVSPSGMTLVKDENGPFGHFWPLKGRLPKRPQVSQYFIVKSVAPVLRRAERYGGEIIQPRRKLADGTGWVGEFTDPIGIVWGVHCPK